MENSKIISNKMNVNSYESIVIDTTKVKHVISKKERTPSKPWYLKEMANKMGCLVQEKLQIKTFYFSHTQTKLYVNLFEAVGYD